MKEAAVFGVVGLVVASSMIAAGLWYCVDDTLAVLVGVPELGRLGFFFVWPMSLLLALLFKGRGDNGDKKGD